MNEVVQVKFAFHDENKTVMSVVSIELERTEQGRYNLSPDKAKELLRTVQAGQLILSNHLNKDKIEQASQRRCLSS